ncbi:MAG: Gfo/Idh/MocA family oxidoreductase [Armatimonadia bacterium]
MEQIRVGMVGAGFAADFHVEAFRQVKGVDCPVVAVTSARAESREAFARKHHIDGVYASVEEMLEKAEVDVLDVCVPTNMHAPVSLLAAQAGKHVIVEKPFTGYTKELWDGEGGEWDGDVPLIGKFVDRRVMLDSVVAQCDEVEKALGDAGSKFCYAENWVYAPAVQKARRLIEAGKGTVLRLLAEESHSGSHASYAKYWALAGGGSLLRTGSHPIGGVCYIKQAEGLAKYGKPIRPKSVMAETAFLTKVESYLAEPKRHVGGVLADCEDWGAAYITFEDGTVADVCSSDVVLGGVYNHMQIFLSNGRIKCNMNPIDAVMAYGPADDSFGEEYLAEKISTRQGWNYASPDEHWASGYHQEIQDFMGAIAEGREPLSGWTLARDVTAVIFAAYVSAWEGRRVEVP